MKLFGEHWSRRELEARVSRMEQLGGLSRFQYADGPEKGVGQIRVRTGSGLNYAVSPERGLDISLCEFAGVPISWQSPAGDIHPGFSAMKDLDWLRTAAGGLLMTCGLTQVGSPCKDGDETLGLHGRAHHTPAGDVCAREEWDGDDYRLTISGVIEERRIHGNHLRLTRRIESSLGKSEIGITDTVENIGFSPSPHMILYHFNFGFPLMDESTVVLVPSRKITPRDTGTPVEEVDTWQKPEPGISERVYYHEDLKAEQGRATVSIRNPVFPSPYPKQTIPLEVQLSWEVEHLPRCVQWKLPASGMNVLGIEPANCHVEGRTAEREKGTLITLQPGETREYRLELSVITEEL